MGMGAFELNNGTIDHQAWTGPLDTMGAVLGSLERGKWSGIGYTVARFNVCGAPNVEDSEGRTATTFSSGVGWRTPPMKIFKQGVCSATKPAGLSSTTLATECPTAARRPTGAGQSLRTVG
jgi:hypothetical protein